MVMNFSVGGYKAQAFYVLWVLENYSSEERKLKQSDIVDIIKNKGHYTDRKSVAKDLLLLKDLGFDVRGVCGELDEKGNEKPAKRGKIWLNRDVTDEKLQLLIDNVLFSNYVGRVEAKELVDYLISLGSDELKKKSATSRIDGGNIYHQDNVEFFKELGTIKDAMTEIRGVSRKIKFKYAQYKYNGNELLLEKQRGHIVSPYFFVSQKGNYYLVGFNHNKNCLWHYRLDYVKNVEILSDYAKPKDETDLKGKSIGKYVLEHPYMFASTVEGIDVRIPSDKMGIVVDAFGESSRFIGEENGYLTFKIFCGEHDAFHWAMQFGAYVEVLSPQKLRNRIRNHVEGMAIKYKMR